VDYDKVLQVEGLSKRFGRRPVIEDLSFGLRRGARVALSAPSGAGKTTLIKILSGLERPDEGTFTLQARNAVTVFQEPRLFPYMTVEENAFLPLRVGKIPLTSDVRERYEGWLEVCDLAPYAHHYPHELSGGMRQKAALVRGFITDPDFVMLDEPFKSVDVEATETVIEHIRRQHSDAALLLVTHNAAEARLLAHSVLVFTEGNLADFTRHRVQASPDTSHLPPIPCPYPRDAYRPSATMVAQTSIKDRQTRS
jgi:ABC-type nitrate/sulfonate/bicarbonate transport system ATPase subunit